MPDQTEIGGLADAVVAATQAYEEASKREAMASSAQVDALNKLNAAQKALNAAFAEMKKTSPRSSDWQQEERRMRSSTVPDA